MEVIQLIKIILFWFVWCTDELKFAQHLINTKSAAKIQIQFVSRIVCHQWINRAAGKNSTNRNINKHERKFYFIYSNRNYCEISLESLTNRLLACANSERSVSKLNCQNLANRLKINSYSFFCNSCCGDDELGAIDVVVRRCATNNSQAADELFRRR